MKMNQSPIQSLKQATRLVTLLSFASGIGPISSAHELRAATLTPPHEFHVRKQWDIGGDGGWGLLSLDTTNHQLYIPRTNRVTVIDTETGKILGEIGGMTNARYIALDDSGKYGYVTDPTDGTAGFVRVFDRSTLKLVTAIPTGRIPATIVFDPATKSVFAFNSHSHSVTVIDSATNQAVATIPLSGRPGSAVADGHGNVFVALPALGEISRIDATAKKVTVSWQLAPCTGPARLAIDATRRQIFTACEDHKLVAINADTGHVTTIGDAPENVGDIDFDPRHSNLFLADAHGRLTIFHRNSPIKYSVLQTVKTRVGARTMVVSHAEDKVYLVTSKFGQNSAAVSEELRFRPTPVPGTFSVIVVGR